MKRVESEGVSGLLFFAAFVAADMLIGINAAIRVAGVACIVCAGYWALNRSIPVGLEDRPASFHLRGVWALVGAGVMLVFGGLLLLFAPQAACALGWAKEAACS